MADALDLIAALSELRAELLERRELQEALTERAHEAEARALELEAKVLELEENLAKRGQRDGLTRADERWLFSVGAEVEFHLPPDGGGQIKIKHRRGGAPLVHNVSTEELFKQRSLRTACGMARNARGPFAAAPGE